MALHPECQTKAQEEIDAVVGTNRLPDFSDRHLLPYLECILQETSRYILLLLLQLRVINLKSTKMESHCPIGSGLIMITFVPFIDKYDLLGIPHLSREDDTYNGMFIPKGSIVIANARCVGRCTFGPTLILIWLILHF